MNMSKTVEKPSKHFIINQNTVIKSKIKKIILENKTNATIFVGDPKDILENHLGKIQKSKNECLNQKNNCKRYFCYFCLKGSYDIIIDQVKNKKDYCCPFCLVFF